jgi:curli biogenesis system outer membrane secretion channel CsgG
MGTRIAWWAGLIVTIGAAQAARAADDPQSRPLVTVIEFETGRTGWAPPPELGATIADLVAVQLVESGLYRVLDREWLERPTDRGRKIPQDYWRLRASDAGVEYVIAGSVTRFSNEERRQNYGGIFGVPLIGGVGRRQQDAIIGLTIRVLDVRTGEVVASANTQGSSTRKSLSIGAVSLLRRMPGLGGGSSSSSGSRDAQLSEAVQEAVAEAARALAAAAPRLRPHHEGHGDQKVHHEGHDGHEGLLGRSGGR